jgi:hypothetical protein
MSSAAPDLPPSTDAAIEPPVPTLPEIADLARPRLRPDVPIMWRSADCVQIGDDITVTRVTRSHVAWMTSLDGLSSPTSVTESLTIDETDARRLLRALLAAGALDDASRIPESARWAAPDERDDAHRRFAATLTAYRDLERAHAITQRRDRLRIEVRGSSRLAAEVAAALNAGGITIGAAQPDLIVLADAPHPDVPAHRAEEPLMRPHLHVGAVNDRATVGPLVVPRVTSCLRCRHLHRTDRDPAWPLLSVQSAQWLGALPVAPVDPLLARIAADWAGLLVRAWVDLPEDPQAWADLAIDLRLPLGVPHVRSCPPHPLCGCRWITP